MIFCVGKLSKKEPYGGTCGATGDLTRLLSHIVIAARIVNREVSMAGLADI